MTKVRLRFVQVDGQVYITLDLIRCQEMDAINRPCKKRGLGQDIKIQC